MYRNIFTEKSIQEWLQANWKKEKQLESLKTQFSHNAPFPHLELQSFFNEQKLLNILKALQKETFLEKEADLFKFMQTNDFCSSQVSELQEFRTFLCSEFFLTYITMLTGISLKKETIDIFASLYQNTDFLLPHDDQLEGRKIAFLIYLSTLEEKDGGKLILYKTKGRIPKEAEKAILPRFNSFIIFTVSEKSFHEVEELIRNKQRIAIGGWFHGVHTQSSIPQKRNY